MPALETYVESSLSPAVLEELLAMGRLARYGEGQFLFREGDHALSLCIVERGQVAIELNIPPQGKVTLTTVEAGEWFSWSALLEPRIHRAAARALKPTEVWEIRGGAILDRSLENPAFGFQIYRALAELVAARLTNSWLEILQSRNP